MSIVRAPRPDSGFVQIRNEVARDERLSYKARGILLDVLSRPDNWETSAEALARSGPDGRHAILTGLRELRDAGYLETVKRRADDGTFRTLSIVYDVPQESLLEVLVTEPECDYPESDNPTSDNPTPIEHSLRTLEPPNGGSSPRTEGQRVNDLTKVYTDRVPLSKFPAVAGVVRKAVRVGMWQDSEIAEALERLAAEGRSVTTDALRYELTGFPDRRTNRDRRLESGVERTRRLASVEARSAWELEG
jgi:hypothetical protein